MKEGQYRGMERIVYLLGAGFSAPLGLPLMSDFFRKSKDMLQEEPTKYAHFAEIFNMVRDMAGTKNYYSANLFNVEEILSILEMEHRVQGQAEMNKFKRYVREVIEHYTPKVTKPVRQEAFENKAYLAYHRFAGAMLGDYLSYHEKVGHNQPFMVATFNRSENPSKEYAIISLNYDLVLENAVAELCLKKTPQPKFGLEQSDVCFAKLHGSVDGDIMVLPTWNKTLNEEIEKAWFAAYNVLASANQL